MIQPSLAEFKRLARRYPVVPVYLECLADELTPMALFHARQAASRSCFLLESVEGGERLGRYSFAAFEPAQVVRIRGGRVFCRNGRGERAWDARDPLEDLRRMLRERRAPEVPGLPRFFGGAVGYVAYDVARSFEKLPDRLPDDLGLPEMFFFFTDEMFVFDHVAHRLKIARCVPVGGKDPARAYRAAEKDLWRAARALRPAAYAPAVLPPPPGSAPAADPGDKKAFVEAVRKAKAYIAAGDVIQTVLSRRISLPTSAEPLDVYRALRRINPSPYMYFLRDNDTHLIGSSPEMLVRLEGRRAETHPIAGTRPRGADPAADQRMAEDLLKDKKERAEHLMLVDLGRNDLGRVCRPGTVKVPEFMKVEAYSHVLHLVSTVTGELEKGRDAFDLFRACFPAGTLTGAPKIRAMEIIEELERTRRGPYGGAVGYVSYTGNMDMAITIRTVVLRKGRAHIQAGAGIVADSVPEKEFLETQNKAAAVVAALRTAEKGNGRRA